MIRTNFDRDAVMDLSDGKEQREAAGGRFRPRRASELDSATTARIRIGQNA